MAQPCIRMLGIHKRFPGVQALSGVDFEVLPGEIHGLVGENGAGKSVLIKILLGAYQKDSGEIYVNGEKVEIRNPVDAQLLGLSAVYQDLMLAPHLSVAENICLGRQPHRCGVVNRARMQREAQKSLEMLGINLDLNARVKDLSVAQQEMVAIAKALSLEAKVLALDEPTAMLSDEETRNLFSVMRKLKASGVSLIYISHRLEEVFEICDRATVLRDGKNVGTVSVSEVDRDSLIKMMVGREVKNIFYKESVPIGKEILRVENLTRKGRFENVSFSLRSGEVLGVFGLVGSGRTHLARALFGADPIDSGRIVVGGQPVRLRHPIDGILNGLALVPEDRKTQGLAARLSVKININLASYGRVSRFGIVSARREAERAQEYVDALSIKTPDLNRQVRLLSGGNQQKVAIAKWASLDSKIFILDEPTVGVDVGAKLEIYELLARLVRGGAGIIFISSYLPEVLGVSDRIIVMCNGRLTGELPRHEATEEKILDLAFRFDHPLPARRKS